MACSVVDESSSPLFGKYELGKLLGCGAFAKVYHARDLRSGESVAIKSISKLQILKNGQAGSVKREISIMRLLRHPHIIRLSEVLATRTRVHFVMDYARGGDLFSKVAGGRFSEPLTRKYFHQLVSAVGYCHARGVFHRDLKPENLLLDENWDLKVADFGLSAVRDQMRVDGRLHTVCGTPAYVAPEVLEKRGYDGGKADVWSCGVVLFVLNAGYLPFNDANLMVMYRKIRRGEFRCPRWTSPELRSLLIRILDPNPGTRMTIDEIMKDPWFRVEYSMKLKHSYTPSSSSSRVCMMNAFDLISYSSGCRLSGLFAADEDSYREDILISAEDPEAVLGAVEGERKDKDWRVSLEGELGVVVSVKRLTDELVVIEIKTTTKLASVFWREKLRPFITAPN